MNSSLGGQPARDGILSLDMHLQSEPLLEDLRSPRKVGAEARGLRVRVFLFMHDVQCGMEKENSVYPTEEMSRNGNKCSAVVYVSLSKDNILN